MVLGTDLLFAEKKGKIHTSSSRFLEIYMINYLILILMPIFKLLRSFVTLSLFNTTLQSEFLEIHLILVQKQSFAQMISTRYLDIIFIFIVFHC